MPPVTREMVSLGGRISIVILESTTQFNVLSGKIRYVNEGVIERSKNVCNTEDQFAFCDLYYMPNESRTSAEESKLTRGPSRTSSLTAGSAVFFGAMMKT